MCSNKQPGKMRKTGKDWDVCFQEVGDQPKSFFAEWDIILAALPKLVWHLLFQGHTWSRGGSSVVQCLSSIGECKVLGSTPCLQHNVICITRTHWATIASQFPSWRQPWMSQSIPSPCKFTPSSLLSFWILSEKKKKKQIYQSQCQVL